MLWSVYHCMCAWHFLFVYIVNQYIHWDFPTSTKFLLEIFLWRLVSVLFFGCYRYIQEQVVKKCVNKSHQAARTENAVSSRIICGWCVIYHLSTCTYEWRPTTSTFCPLGLPARKSHAGVTSQLCSKWSSKGPFSENFLSTDGFFECNYLSCYGARLAEEETEKEDEQFWFFNRFRLYSHLRTSFGYYHCYCRLGQPIQALLNACGH